MTKMGGGDDKVQQSRPTSLGAGDSDHSTREKSAIPCTQEHDMTALAKIGTLREKAQEVLESSSSTLYGETIHPKTADWARVLDAATQRRTEVLAPENLENMWARGRNYKDKLNRAGKGRQVSRKKGLANSDMHSGDLQKPAFIKTDESTKMVDKAIVQYILGSSLTTECIHSKANEAKLSHSLVGDSTSRGSIVDDINANAVPGISSKARLKRSNSTSALKIETDEKRANINDTKGIIISEEFYSPDFGRQNMEQNFQGAIDTVLHVETAPSPKLRCRVLGAYFEKLGSNSFAVYSIAVTDSENNTWFVKRRYRNFERLHRHLKDIPNYTLHLPPKRIFSSSTEDAFVHQRCIQLDRYLQDLLSIANVAEQHEVWDFLSVSSKNYSFGKSPSVMRTLAVNVDDAVDDIVRQFKGVSDGLMRKVVGSSPSPHEASLSVPNRNLSWNVDDFGSQVSGPSSIERANSSSSDDDECDKDQLPASTELGNSAQSSMGHSDNELDERKIDAKDFHPLIIKKIEESRSVDFEKNTDYDSKSERTVKDRTMSLPSVSAYIDDPVRVPPEWSPPNVTVPALNLVDKIFQLNRRGWLRRQVFWISKQILQLVMEDAIDDWLLGQINMLRRDDVVAQGIRWVKDTLWPEGKFFLKLELNSGLSNETAFNPMSSQTSTHAAKSKAHPSSSFEAQLEAARRASDVKKLLLNGAPSALVSLIGQKQYRRCSRDIYYFLQSSICIKQLAYGGLELVIISIFPELRELVLDIHKKMRREPVTRKLKSVTMVDVKMVLLAIPRGKRSSSCKLGRRIALPKFISRVKKMMTRALVLPACSLGTSIEGNEAVSHVGLRCSSSKSRIVVSCSRSHSNIPKLKPFSRNLLDRALEETPLIQKTVNEISDYCTTLEGDACYSCWRAYFELKELEKVAPKEDLERTIVESNGLASLIGSIHRSVSIYNLKKAAGPGGGEEDARAAAGKAEEKRAHEHVPDGLPQTEEELEEEEKGRMAESPHTRLLRVMGKFPAWYTPAPDHQTD
ncbi:hypothetical protein V2J09_016592 [Rumex salicifolius]